MATPEVRQCSSCGGLYRPLQADDVVYFHACPSQRVLVGAVVDPVSGKVTAPATFTATVNPRDENVVVTAAGKVITKLGDPNGFTVVTDPAKLALVGVL